MTPSPDDRSESPARLRSIVVRGLTRRCARCGRGPLYSRWIDLHEHCPECGLLYLENQGDPWFFQLVIDRAAFVLPIIAALFFGLHRASPALFVLLCALLIALFLYTTPHRYGVCVALDYYSRLRLGAQGADDDDPSGRTPDGSESPRRNG